MKKSKKGFTLVELLAVIVVLGIIMTVAGISVMRIRKNANIEQAKQLEKTLEDLGPSIYSYEMTVKKDKFYENYNSLNGTTTDLSGKNVDDRKIFQGYSLLITLDGLNTAGYLKNKELKIGNNDCEGFLRIYKTSNGPYFEGNICCLGIYDTNNNGGSNCGWFKKSNVAEDIENYNKLSEKTGFVTDLSN